MKIQKEPTKGSLEFLKKYIPNLSEHEAYIRQSELQLFTNGQESSINNLSKEDAQKEIDKILDSLHRKARSNKFDILYGLTQDLENYLKY